MKSGREVRVRMRLSARTLPDVPSGNVLGELVGSEKPDEIVVVGGHLDSWDKGHGAHDDGGGCMQAIETLHLLQRVGFKPKRTIRAVMFMNEENGRVDISPIVSRGVPGVGLVVEDHRYFDYHHSANDTIDAVHPRELEMGAILADA